MEIHDTFIYEVVHISIKLLRNHNNSNLDRHIISLYVGAS